MSLEQLEILIYCMYLLMLISFPVLGYALGDIRRSLKELKEIE